MLLVTTIFMVTQGVGPGPRGTGWPELGEEGTITVVARDIGMATKTKMTRTTPTGEHEESGAICRVNVFAWCTGVPHVCTAVVLAFL